MIKRGVILALLVCSCASAQLDSNTVTVTASQTTNLQPDQVVFGITVSSGLTASLDDVVTALQGSGVSGANFSGVSSNLTNVVSNGNQPILQWSFMLAVPLTKMKDTATALTSLQLAIPKKNNGLTMNFYVQGGVYTIAAIADLFGVGLGGECEGSGSNVDGRRGPHSGCDPWNVERHVDLDGQRS